MQKGFSTLYIVIILGSIALGLALSIATSSLWSVRGSLDSKNSSQARVLSDACAEVALELMRENTSYTGSGSQILGTNTCNYTVTNTGGNTRAVSVTTTIQGLTRKLQITTQSFNPITISSWQEVP